MTSSPTAPTTKSPANTSSTKGYQKTLLISFIIITGYMIVEAVGGWLTGSLALLSDAGHMLSDAVALGATLLAFKIGEKTATRQKTFGYKRFEILVAGANGATLIIISIMIIVEAIKRLNSPPEIATQGMLIIAFIGALVNILVAGLMHLSSNDGHGHGDHDHSDKHGHDDPHNHDSHEHDGHNHEKHDHSTDHSQAHNANQTVNPAKKQVNLNMQSAYLHVLSDLLGSVAAIIAALLMMGFGWVWADALASVIVAVLILISGYRVVRDSAHILMEGTPKGISLVNVESLLLSHPSVDAVHDLHVWSITSGLHALSCHVVVDGDMSISEASVLIRELGLKLQTLDITHATIQVESPTHSQLADCSEALVCDIAARPAAGGSHFGHSH